MHTLKVNAFPGNRNRSGLWKSTGIPKSCLADHGTRDALRFETGKAGEGIMPPSMRKQARDHKNCLKKKDKRLGKGESRLWACSNRERSPCGKFSLQPMRTSLLLVESTGASKVMMTQL